MNALDGIPLTGRPLRVVAAVLSTVAVLLATVAVVGAVSASTRDATVEARQAAVAASTKATAALLSYDSASIGTAERAIGDLTVGGFRDQFTRVFTRVVKPNALEQHARSTATVMAASWVSATPDRVVTLLFINQSTSSTQLQGDRVDTIQARVTMAKVGDRWLIAGLDQV